MDYHAKFDTLTWMLLRRRRHEER